MAKKLGFWPTAKRLLRWQRRMLAWALFVGLVYFVTYAVYYRAVVTPAQWLNVLVIVVLVIVTALYASETANIAGRTREQTNEMKKQREQALLPILVAKCKYSTRYVDGDELFALRILNIGPGPALDIGVTRVAAEAARIRAAWAIGRKEYLPIPCGDMWDIGEMAPNHGPDTGESMSILVSEEGGFCIVMECNDTYGYSIGALREFEISKNKSGHFQIKEIQTVSAQRIKEKVRDYPRVEAVV